MSIHQRILKRTPRSKHQPVVLRLSHRLRGILVVAVYVILVLTFFVMFVTTLTPSSRSIERLSLAQAVADRTLYRTQLNNRLRVLPAVSDRTIVSAPTAETIEAYEQVQTSLMAMIVPASERSVHQSVVGYVALIRETFDQLDGSITAGWLSRLQQLRSQILSEYPWVLLP